MPTFSKKHYELVAKALAKAKPPMELPRETPNYTRAMNDLQAKDQQWIKDVETLAEAFAADNPSFNEERFTTAVMDLGKQQSK